VHYTPWHDTADVPGHVCDADEQSKIAAGAESAMADADETPRFADADDFAADMLIQVVFAGDDLARQMSANIAVAGGGGVDDGSEVGEAAECGEVAGVAGIAAARAIAAVDTPAIQRDHGIGTDDSRKTTTTTTKR
jgi:hypothetical protein